jgi:mRNA interferase MazF
MGVRQYQIVIVNLDPTVGSEIKKTRPCLILSPEEMNVHLKTVVVAPLTSSKRNYPTRSKVELDGKMSRVALDQIRTIDKRRIVKVGQQLKTKEILEVKSIIRMTYVE